MRGVTLLELMVVVAIFGVISSLGFVSFERLKANYNLTERTNKLYSDIEWIRQKSMGSADPYGISFTGNNYSVFKDADHSETYNEGDTILKTEHLGHITLSGYPDSYAYTRRGTPSQQQFTITLTSQYSNKKQITIFMFKTRIK